MAKIQKGNLVMMFRRRTPGMGIVLKIVTRADVVALTILDEGLRVSMLLAPRHADFAKIHWYKKPSYYEVNAISQVTWQPIKGLKKVS